MDEFIITCFCVLDEMLPEETQGNHFRQRGPFIRRSGWWLARSSTLLIITVCLSILHHIDNVLRVDHSGWYFILQITPFTFSQLIYVIFLYIAITPFWPWFRVGAMAFVYLVVQTAHVVVENPAVQYRLEPMAALTIKRRTR